MPRLARVDVGGEIYHVINRAVGRLKIFTSKEDYQLFVRLLTETKKEVDMRILAYTLMPNHWHLVLYPKEDGDLGRFMHRLTNAHTRIVHVRTRTIGYGPLYQGRYKSFLIEKDRYLLALIKYVERNPVRAKLTPFCENWQWGSAWIRIHGSSKQQQLLTPPPATLPRNYRTWINTKEKEDTLSTIRTSVHKGVPYGKETWVERMVDRFNLQTTQRSVGRPKKS